MLEIPKVASVNVSEGTVYTLRFDNTFGWAVVVVSDATGMLAITSDWGEWAFRWNLRGMPEGHTLTQFLATTDGDYVARKFLGAAAREYDPDGTKREWKAQICRLRREGMINRLDARAAWSEVADFDFEQRETFPDVPFIEEPWEMSQSRDTNEYRAITRIVWPAFRDVLRDRAKAAA